MRYLHFLLHRRISRTSLFVGILLFGALSFGHTSYADLTQTDYTTQGTLFYEYGFPQVTQTLGTGLTGNFGDIQLALDAFGATKTVEIFLNECDTDEHSKEPLVTGCILKDTYSQTVTHTGSAQLINFTNGINYTADPSKYYSITMQQTTSYNAVYIYGSATNTYTYGESWTTSGSGHTWYDHLNTAGSYMSDAYLVISGINEPSPTPFGIGVDSLLNSIQVNSPADNTNLTSPYNVNFIGKYNYASGLGYVYDKIHFELTKLPDLVSANIADITLTSGVQNFNYSFQLTADKYYTFRAYLFNSSDSTIPKFYSNTINLSTGNSGIVNTLDTQYETCAGITDIGCQLKNVMKWAFIPSPLVLRQFGSLTLANSLPFSYIYDMGSVYNELFANGGTQEYSVGVDDGIFGHISFISASQINAVPYASTIKTILGYLLYFFTAVTLYRIVLKVHDKATPTT
jgi:hypothetical protein